MSLSVRQLSQSSRRSVVVCRGGVEESRAVHLPVFVLNWWISHPVVVLLISGLIISGFPPVVQAGDILRGGATSASGRKASDARANAGAQAAELAKTKAADRLARTTKAINDMRTLQSSARAAAGASVPDGLTTGGLKVLTGANAKWTGATAPVQNGNTVTIKQTESQALLHWETFNVGRKTTLTFNQKAGGDDSGKWIAFNKVFDPSGQPSQILGSIKADGQVYVINQNGIVFGAGSQVNTRTFVASSLPINDNLVSGGLLNNKDAQFLFSALSVPGGTDGTPAFIPTAPLTANGKVGDIIVQKGAKISGPVSADGNGGRVMLVGANVRNEGTISTPSGQTILAAGLQVGVQAHDSDDPSLRGLDVWIGNVGDYAGSATNSGIIESYTGSVLMAGKKVSQFGVIDSTTSVNLNGRIDLLASYGATANPNYDSSDGGGPIFLNQFTGTVLLGPQSVTRILPDYASTKTVPGLTLAENSRINVQGLSIQMQGEAVLLAPHADVTFQAGKWTYTDVDNNRTIFKADGTTVENALSTNFSGGAQRFFYSGGQVFFDSGSLLDVSGSTDVFVALAQHVLTVQFRGTELADAPLQRLSALRGQDLVVDIRRSGEYGGIYWVGSPLGDLTGVAGIIEHNVAQLTAEGGTVNIRSGGSIVVQPGSTVDVSGGYFRNEGGVIQTSRLLRNGTLIDIANATPDLIYDGVYEGKSTALSSKWGVGKTYTHALAPLGGYRQSEYIEGAAGGEISFTAPSIIIGGDLVGQTITGPKQLDSPVSQSSLSFAFKAEARYAQTADVIRYYETSPAPPVVSFSTDKPGASAFVLVDGQSLPESLTSGFLVSTSWWDEKEGGFGHVTVDNKDGDAFLASGIALDIPVGGSLTVEASNIAIDGTIHAPGGMVSLTAYNFSPYKYQELEATNALSNQPAPGIVSGRGTVILGSAAKIDVSGMIVDDRPTTPQAVAGGRVLEGGSVSLEGYSIFLSKGSVIDASGGARAKPVKGFEFGAGGSISILAGRDPDLSTSIGGSLILDGTLAAFSAEEGGSLALRANLIQIGGSASDPSMLVLDPEFFQSGGFSSYSLAGIGKADGTGYIPAIRIVEGTIIEPVAETLVVSSYKGSRGGLLLVPVLKPVGERHPVSLSLSASGADDSFTIDVLEARGDIVMEKGSVIRTDPGASVLIGTDADLEKTLADTISIEGTIEAPGGTVALFTRNKFRLAPTVEDTGTSALPTVYIGPEAKISVAGTVVHTSDPFGRRVGILYGGGTLSIYGNIVAEAGAVLDVSGASGIFDIHPSLLDAAGDSIVPVNSGLNSSPYLLRSVATQVDSDGGYLSLHGAEMLLSDATLLGAAGGPSAVGGFLSIFSGRYYAPGASRTSADINLLVTQSGNVLSGSASSRGVGIAVRDSGGAVVSGMGYFSADRFVQGGFDSLDLGYKFIENASPISYGGNVEFVGPVSIAAAGSLRVAGGGIIKADSAVQLSARYIAVGQEYREPVNPTDSTFIAFKKDPVLGSDTLQYFPTPTYGTGTVRFVASLIDIGTTVFQNTGQVAFTAINGDIRGDGTLSLAGDLTLTAGQIYPNTLASFNIFAYDHAGGVGSVTIKGSGVRPMPYSAGGSLNIYASIITQGGTLRAPFGSIVLGWDGSDLDPSTTKFDSPENPVVGSVLTVPTAQSVVLQSSSMTSVSALDPVTGEGLLIPFGLSPDGLSWIDPRGVTVTVSGLPQKSIAIAGNSVVTESGSVIDIRGGGDLLGYRWVSGTGGSRDLLGEAGDEWGSGVEYEAGDLVTYNGETWSARVAIDPDDFKTSPTPQAGLYWTRVEESYAIVPGYAAEYAPFSVHNTGDNATALGGDPGFTSSTLNLGDRIYIDGVDGLSAGYYTLLPRRYALLPGAFLITPKSSGTFARYTAADGSAYTGGYRVNAFHQPSQISGLRSLYEVASPTVLASRAKYEVLGVNEFIAEAAKRLDVEEVQQLPIDAGHLSFQGNSSLRLEGGVLAGGFSGGRGASVDVSSDADIYVVGGSGSAPVGATVVLDAGLLSSWGVESLLIGGLRRTTSSGGTAVDVHTKAVTLDNPGEVFSSPEITLVSKEGLTVTAGSIIASSGDMSQPAEEFLLSGDGALLRVSGDTSASIVRSATTGSTLPLMTIGAGAVISGSGVILDSTYATSLDPASVLNAEALTLGSGQISIVFSEPSGGLTGSVVPTHLVLRDSLLQYVQSVDALTLSSYRSIDIYGAGSFGSPSLRQLTLQAGGDDSSTLAVESSLRGFEQGSGAVVFAAGSVIFENPSSAIGLASPTGPLSGELRIQTEVMEFGKNAFGIGGYGSLNITASQGMLAIADGALTLPGAFIVSTPLITAAKGVSYDFSALGDISLLSSGGVAGVAGGFGASLDFTGASITANTDIRLPSGSLVLHASGGNVSVGGKLSATGTAQNFYDITRYANAGSIEIISDTGDVILDSGSEISVAGAQGGGDAGAIQIRAAAGMFVNNGTLLGSAASGETSGSFLLDAGSIVSYSNINDALEAGGFFEERQIRVRTGDVTVDGTTHARSFSLSTDLGSITVTGTIDASGETGGDIELAAANNLTLASTAVLTVAAEHFSNAGKGGHVTLEAGVAVNGTANTSALLDLQAGSAIDLSVQDYVAGDYITPGSSAFYGQFEGILHLRAPRLGNDVRVDAIDSTITGGSSIIVEAFRVYQPTNGTMNIALRNTMDADNKAFMNAGESAIRTKVLGTLNTALDPILVVAPGVEIINPTGDLTLGLANNSASGSTNAEALTGADWDLSKYRYGSRNAPGFLTLRAQGDVIINNTLSDGFNAVSVTADNGHSSMWLATLMAINTNLPLNTQSWSYRLTAGADFSAAQFGTVLSKAALNILQPGKGSVLVGEFYNPVPNETSSGTAAAIGELGQTADSIRISTTATNRGTRYEVIRTGTGDINISAGRDVQLRNQFATIYTAGVALSDPTRIFQAGDFVTPVLNKTPSQTGEGGTSLGATQQNYAATWSLGGGNVSILAGANIGHYTKDASGLVIVDSSRQMPTNWLYRRGYVDDSGLFAADGGIDGATTATRVTDTATSTTWWIDFSNFFEGVGALGGGDVLLVAGNDVVNVDAVSPTNARMAGKNPLTGENLAPDEDNLLELGGGDVTVRAGNNIDGGVYYVERGKGTLFAGGEITTNSARAPQLGILDIDNIQNGTVYDSSTWLPTTLFVGKAHFEVSALKDVLLGPIANPFFLPQGLNNKFWYKTYFNTYSSEAGVDVASFGGSVTHRTTTVLPNASTPVSLLSNWFTSQNLFTGNGSFSNASYYQPWIRLAELDISAFQQVFNLAVPNLRSSAFSGNVNLIGSMTLFPSATGTLELVASGGIIGLQAAGVGTINRENVNVWVSSTVNISDADPSLFPGVTTPLGYQQFVGRERKDAVMSNQNPYIAVNLALQETGSYSGQASSIDVKRALHSSSLLHTGDLNPVRLYAAGGDITGLTLFSPKMTRTIADRDITDIAFYIQNVSADDVSIVSAGRDLIPYNESAPVRALASDIARKNYIGDSEKTTSTGTLSKVLAGDVQINGPGLLEVFAGRNIDLGTGPNYADGTGIGITSIGNLRNPFLPFSGASIIALAGIQGSGGGAAVGLAGSSLDFGNFSPGGTMSALKELDYAEALKEFFGLLQQASEEYETTGSYDTGYAAIASLFGNATGSGEIFTRARDIRTVTGGAITLMAPGGGLTLASDIFGNPLTPPGIVTEYGGEVSIFAHGSVDIGRARIFTLRGGDMTIWSSTGDIAAGSASKTVVTAPPTRVVFDTTSADVVTDLGGLATGGGIGVLASVEGVPPGNVFLIAPEGTVDAGDAGIQATGNLRIAAAQVLNADNISTGGTASGVPSAPTVAAPNISGLSSASTSTGAATSAASSVTNQATQQQAPPMETPSIITVEVLGYGGDDTDEG